MTTTSFNPQLNTAGGINQRPHSTGNGNGGSDGSQFSALLAFASTPAPAPAPEPAPAAKQDTAKPAEAEKPEQPDDAAPQQAAKPADSKTDAADSKDDAAAKADDDKADDDSTAKAGDPASAMLALMASLHKPGADAGKTTTAAQAFDALSGKGKRTDAGQLAALQAAMKSVAKEAGVDAAGAKIFSATSIKNPALAAAGADLGADKAAASADLRATLGNVKADVKPQLDAAEFSLQQARDAALLAQKEQAPVATVAAAQLQPAMLEAAQAAAAAGEELSAHVGTDAWNDQVGQKVIYMVGAEDQTASLTLNPPDLGPLQVVLSVSNGQADVTFSSNQLEVRQALENALPRLQEMMSESGIALGNATVNAGMSNGGQAQQDQAMASSGFGRGNNGRGNGGNGENGTAGEAAVRPATRTARIGDRGMVDTFA